MKKAGILLCAGSASRMGFSKLTTPLPDGHTALMRSLLALIKGGADEIVIAVSEHTRAHAEHAVIAFSTPTAPAMRVVSGGQTRQESVYNALLHTDADVVAIHDAARCLADAELVKACFESAEQYGSGIAAAPVHDTVVQVSDGCHALERESLLLTQTPQAFLRERIVSAYALAKEQNLSATDDCTLYAKCGYEPHFVRNEKDNRKLTTPGDWEQVCAMLRRNGEAPTQPTGAMRIGYGEDLHRLVPDRALVLGGITIEHELGLLGHSDADVLTHAIMDALLGAAALGDIGRLFPDTDERYRGIESILLLRQVYAHLSEHGFAIGNIDATIVAQRPKLAPHIPQMQKQIAACLELAQDRVSIKATTTEGLGAEGEQKAITARAVATVFQRT